MLTTDVNDGPAVVMQATGLPANNSYYTVGNDVDFQAYITKRDPRRLAKDGLAWGVECEWATRQKEENRDEDGDPNEDPTTWRKQLSWGFVSRTVPVEKAFWVSNSNNTRGARNILDIWKARGGAPVNSAGQLINPPPEKDDSRMVVRIVRWERPLLLPPRELAKYRDAVNPDAFRIRQKDFPDPARPNARRPVIFDLAIETREAKMMDISLEEDERTVNGKRKTYFRMTYDMLIDTKEGWYGIYQDKGITMFGGIEAFDQRGGSLFDGTPTGTDPIPAGVAPAQNIIDAQGREISGPQLFDGLGNPIHIDPLRLDRDPSVYLKYRIYDDLPFRRLAL